MRIDIRWRNMDAVLGLEEAVRERADRLHRSIGRFDPESGGTDLIVHLEHFSKKNLYEASASLHLTTHNHLHARGEGNDVMASVGQAFDELARQVRKIKARYDSALKNSPAMDQAAVLLGGEHDDDDGEEVIQEEEELLAHRNDVARSAALAPEQMGRLVRSIRRELRFQIATNDLEEGRIDPLAVLDEAVAATLSRLGDAPGDSVEMILHQEAMSAVERRIRAMLDENSRGDISTERVIPEEDPDDEIDNGSNTAYLQPLLDLEGSLHVEDTIAVDRASPDEVAETLELEDRIDVILRQYPAVVRSTFLLATLEDLSLEQVARTLGISPETATEHLATARRVVAQALEPDVSPYWRRILSKQAPRQQSPTSTMQS